MPNATDFIRDLHTNANLLTEVQNAAAEIVTVATNHGYTVTLQGISDALKAHWRSNAYPTDPPDPTAPTTPKCLVVFSEAPGY
jgi:metal-dependent amidase/aminoacylase/carboxypeptidase family protein